VARVTEAADPTVSGMLVRPVQPGEDQALWIPPAPVARPRPAHAAPAAPAASAEGTANEAGPNEGTANEAGQNEGTANKAGTADAPASEAAAAVAWASEAAARDAADAPASEAAAAVAWASEAAARDGGEPAPAGHDVPEAARDEDAAKAGPVSEVAVAVAEAVAASGADLIPVASQVTAPSAPAGEAADGATSISEALSAVAEAAAASRAADADAADEVNGNVDGAVESTSPSAAPSGAGEASVIRPPRLRAGDPIRVVAPSGPVAADDFQRGAAVLASRYELRFDPAMLQRAQGYLAGPDAVRLAELEAALRDPEARAVIAARGGYGLLRILARLPPELLRNQPKPIVAFSDGTALLAHLAAAGVTAIHGPPVTQLGRLPGLDQQALFDALAAPEGRLLLSGLCPVVGGRAQGRLLGGNLEVFSRLIGTPFLPDTRGAILFFEEVGERPYRIDRLFTQLELAGILGRAAAVIIGDFVACEEPTASRVASPTAEEVARERLSRLPIPVVVGAPVGHGERNHALPYGARAELDADAGTLTALEGAVS
jgi:muramoyltetrapeptide carboxypeptidase